MPFGVVGQLGSRMRQPDGIGDCPARRCTKHALLISTTSNSAFTLATCCHTCRHTSRRTCRQCERTRTQVAQLVAESFPTGDMCADLLPSARQFHSPEVAAARRLVGAHVASVKGLGNKSAHMSSNKLSDLCGDMCGNMSPV